MIAQHWNGPQGTVYQILKIQKPDDFDKLIVSLPEAYDPSAVAETLKARISPLCQTVLVEYPYIDKDYRSTYYNFYSKKGFRYDSACARLHFFTADVSLNPGLDLATPTGNLKDQYFGYMVLRPTRRLAIGRTVLAPALMLGFHGFLIEAEHPVHLLGRRFSVKGFPYMEQHKDISVCAHAACWAILRHYSERFPRYAEYLTYDVTRMAQEFDPGGVLPSHGLQLEHAERIFAAAGTYPLVIDRLVYPESFERMLLAYVESGFPLYATLPSHAVAVVGHGERIPAPSHNAPTYFAAELTRGVVVVDDNHLPYVSIDRAQNDPFALEDIEAFIVPLPEKVYYSAEAVDELSASLASGKVLGFDHSSLGPTVIRYFLTTSARLRECMHNVRSQFDPNLIEQIMEISLPQFVWIVEIASLEQWKNGQIASRAIVDATAGPHELNPVFAMYDQSHAVLFDRGGEDPEGYEIKLNSPAATPLSRMEGKDTGNLPLH